MHVIVPFVGRKNGKLFDCQQSYNVLVLRVPGLEEGVKHCDRWPEHSCGCWVRRANIPSICMGCGGVEGVWVLWGAVCTLLQATIAVFIDVLFPLME